MVKRPIITLLTDFGSADWYVASMKAVILRQFRDANLINITHEIPAQDILRGSICLERVIAGFPKNSIHLAVVDPGVGSSRRILIAEIAGQFIIAPDNGLITWPIRRIGIAMTWELTWRPATFSATFHGRDIMAPAAAMLAAGKNIGQLALRINNPTLLDVHLASGMIGQIIHIDHFGNAMTNIPQSQLTTGNKTWDVMVHGHLLAVHQTYSDVASGQPLALIGSSDLLEIAVRNGSAASQLNLAVGDKVELQ